jgi:superfamily I DNA/RNA helicase
VANSNALIAGAKNIIGDPAIANYDGPEYPIDAFVSPSNHMEAMKIAEDIRYLIGEGGCEPSDIAILYRVHSQAVSLEDALFSLKVPYYSYSKRAFYERKEVLDIFAYLRLLADPVGITKNEFKRIANKPNNFIAATTIDKIFQIKKEERCSVIRAMELCDLDQNWAYQGLMKFKDKLMSGVSFAAGAQSVDQVVDYILKNIGYLTYMAELLEAKDAEADLEGNFDAIKASASRFADIGGFLDHIEELKAESDKDENGNWVKLRTIHSAKGLQYKHVFVAGICDRMYPFYKCETDDDIEQERRIMYVAVTRPERYLHLSCIEGKYGNINVKLSPFIHKMLVNYDEIRARDLGAARDYQEEDGIQSTKMRNAAGYTDPYKGAGQTTRQIDSDF